MNGSLYKRGSVYWMAIRVNGKLYRKSTGKTTKCETIDFLDEQKKEVKANKHPSVLACFDMFCSQFVHTMTPCGVEMGN